MYPENTSFEEWLISSCENFLTRLENSRTMWPLSPQECIDLFSALGELQFNAWSEILDRTVARRVRMAGRRFFARLAELNEIKHAELRECFERGAEELVVQIEKAVGDAESHLATGELGSVLTSYEFDALLMHPLDRLAYALELAQRIRIVPAGLGADRISFLRVKVETSLPRFLAAFREAGDPIYRVKAAQFPSFLWWYPFKSLVHFEE